MPDDATGRCLLRDAGQLGAVHDTRNRRWSSEGQLSHLGRSKPGGPK